MVKLHDLHFSRSALGLPDHRLILKNPSISFWDNNYFRNSFEPAVWFLFLIMMRHFSWDYYQLKIVKSICVCTWNGWLFSDFHWKIEYSSFYCRSRSMLFRVISLFRDMHGLKHLYKTNDRCSLKSNKKSLHIKRGHLYLTDGESFHR